MVHQIRKSPISRDSIVSNLHILLSSSLHSSTGQCVETDVDYKGNERSATSSTTSTWYTIFLKATSLQATNAQTPKKLSKIWCWDESNHFHTEQTKHFSFFFQPSLCFPLLPPLPPFLNRTEMCSLLPNSDPGMKRPRKFVIPRKKNSLGLRIKLTKI